MKKEDLRKLIGEDLGEWEIANVGYDFSTRTLDFVLREFVWKGIPFSRDYKEYTGEVKKVRFFDEFAFFYLEDGVYVNSVKNYVESEQGLNLKSLDNLIKNPQNLYTTHIQNEWLYILKRLNLFDVKEYNKTFVARVKEEIVKYYKNNNKLEDLRDTLKFFNDINAQINV